MTIASLFRVLIWAAATGFFADVLRRCVATEAISLLPLAAIAVLFCAVNLRAAWRTARHKAKPESFMRPNTPDFPEQPRRGVR